MTEVTPPTHEELCEDEVNIKSVYRDVDPSWRHGVYIDEVFHRVSDNTYWEVSYRRSTDCETHELRERICPINRVYPVRTVTTKYVTKPAEPELKLWSWFADYGRSGDLEGLIIASDSDILDAVGKRAYFGEALGKHSEIDHVVKHDEFELVSSEQFIVLELFKLSGRTVSGHNPLQTIEDCEYDD